MKNLSEMINEAAGDVSYRVSLNGCEDDGVPMTVVITIKKDQQTAFEKFLKDEEGGIFGHAEGGNVEY